MQLAKRVFYNTQITQATEIKIKFNCGKYIALIAASNTLYQTHDGRIEC